jgi:acyl carrier protein
MKEKEFEKIIYKSIDKKIKNLNKLEWDSLAQLSILMNLEKKFPNKITSIKKISEITNYNDLLEILKKNKIIKND